MSSAYRIRLAPGESGRLVIEFMAMLSRRGPRMEPWGTPEVTGAWSEVVPSRTTHCSQSVR